MDIESTSQPANETSRKKIGSPCFIWFLIITFIIVLIVLGISYFSERCRLPDGPCDLRYNSSLYK